jgi:murein DD-endopeptidase MepM/ murein hydrolase activator NlpD
MRWAPALARLASLAVLSAAIAQVAPPPAMADDDPRKPTPRPTPPAVVLTFTPEQYAQAQAIADATSLSARVDAERKLAAEERVFLGREQTRIRADRDRIVARIGALQVRITDRQKELERVVTREYRESRRTPLEVLLSSGSILSVLLATDSLGTLAAAERDAIDELQRAQAALDIERSALAAREGELVSLADALAAKEVLLARFSAQAERLATGGVVAEVKVLRELVDTELAATAKIDQLIAAAAAAAGATPFQRPLGWVRPARGAVSQAFGPSALSLEPPRVFGGVTFPHFHDGLDIAAALGSPVLAAADGRVAFVGHLPDGAMVVLIAHDGGLFTLYAHLDDTQARPPVKAGDAVRAGDHIGAVGLTGITTGAHLHFVIRRGDEPLDPNGLLPPS